MQKLIKLIDQLETQIPHAQVLNTAVSEGNVGWHIEHSCLVMIKIAETFQQSNPNQYHTKFNFKKLLVFLLGKFPRGKAKAPASVMPTENISIDHLKESIAKARLAIQKIMAGDKNKFFLHPFFGNLNRPQTLNFFGIHTKHHLLIIADILK